MQLEATATAVTNSPAFTADDVARFYANGWWTGTTISDAVRVNATRTRTAPPTWITRTDP